MALNFDSSLTQHLTSSWAGTQIPLTIACWFRVTNITDDHTLVMIADSSSADNYIVLRAAGGTAGDPIYGESNNGAVTSATTTNGYSADTWHHAAVVLEPGANDEIRVFLDGANKGTNTSASSPTNLDTVGIGYGADSTPDLPIDGDLAEIAIFDKALTDGEIAILAKGAWPFAIRPSPPVGRTMAIVRYWPLFGRYSPEIDTVFGFDATLQNGPTATEHPRVFYAGRPYIGLTAATTTSTRIISNQLFVDWDFDDTYTDETAYFLSASGTMRIAPTERSILSAGGIVDRCQVVLDNTTQRFTPLNSNSPIYSALQDGKAYHAPMYLQVAIGGGAYTRIFTGIIKVPREAGATNRAANTVTLDCRSDEERMLSKRITTTLGNFTARAEAGQTEAEWIADILEDGGLTASRYTLDDGLFVIPYVWNDHDSAIDLCWKLAAACGGRFYADPSGEFVYENMMHWLVGSEHSDSQAELTEKEYGRLEPYYEDKELFYSVTLEARPRSRDASATIWEADDIYVVPASTTGSDYVTIWAELDSPCYSIETATYDAVTSGGGDISGNVTLTQTNYAQRVKLQFQNSNSLQAAEIQNLAITGEPISATDDVVLTLASTDAFWTGTNRGRRDRVLGSNQWIQTQSQLETLTTFLRDRHETPRLFWKISDVQGIPARRMGDRLTIRWPLPNGTTTRQVWVTGITWRLDKAGFRQTYTAVDTEGYFAHEGSYFVIGTSQLGSTDFMFY